MELIRAFIKLMNLVTVQEGQSVQTSPDGWDHETAHDFVFFLITPVARPLKLPWAMLPAPVSTGMSRAGD